jgi:lipoprotein Spr
MKLFRMKAVTQALVLAGLMLSQTPTVAKAGSKGGVISKEARKQNLLEYIQKRNDLTKAEKATWDKEIRRVFGGKAIKDGTDEGVTVAKSVISAGIFFQIKPARAAKAAYGAYHDTYRWIPPPIAIDYQILDFMGRKPKVRSWDLAYDFPRYFNEEMAPDIVAWWEEMLKKDKIPAYEKKKIEDTLRRTKQKMKPLLLERLKMATILERQYAQEKMSTTVNKKMLNQLEQELIEIEKELQESFRDVSRNEIVDDPDQTAFDRFALFAQELGEPVPPRPDYLKVIEKEKTDKKDSKAKKERQNTRPKSTPTKQKGTKKPTKPKKQKGKTVLDRPKPILKKQQSAPYAPPVDAPLGNENLIPLFRGWKTSLKNTVDGWVGVPYKFGGTTKRGVDCSAFVQAAFKDGIGVAIPRNSRMQAVLGSRITQKQLKKGDLVFFDTLDRGRITHVGIFMGNGKVIHAGCSKGVTYIKLNKRYYQRAYRASRRILQH